MLDLNTLIAPGSGWQLTRAININDRGEILVVADPLGVTPIDDADLGHLVLLVPCDSDDADWTGNAEAIGVAPQSSTRIINSLVLTPRENVAAWCVRMMRRYHVPIVGAPKN
jgi:hypothetical protein